MSCLLILLSFEPHTAPFLEHSSLNGLFSFICNLGNRLIRSFWLRVVLPWEEFVSMGPSSTAGPTSSQPRQKSSHSSSFQSVGWAGLSLEIRSVHLATEIIHIDHKYQSWGQVFFGQMLRIIKGKFKTIFRS